MIRARHTLTGRLVSELYSGPKLNRAFPHIDFMGEGADEGSSILMLSNHFSWWDGFIQYRLNRRSFRRKLHVMMLEEQLLRNRILNRCGCFSVKKSSRDIIQSLDYCVELMAVPSNMVLIFPQGEIQSMHIPDVKFQSGIGYLLRHIDVNYQIVLNVNLVDYYSHKTPRLSCYYKVSAGGSQFQNIKALEAAYNEFYLQCKTKQQTAL